MGLDSWDLKNIFPLLRDDSTLTTSYPLTKFEIPFGLKKRIIFVGTSSGWRYDYFTKSLSQSHPDWKVKLVEYESILDEDFKLSSLVKKGDIVRIETPEMNFNIDKQILSRGVSYTENEGYWYLTDEELSALNYDKGRILPFRQWYLGFCDVLSEIVSQLSECDRHALLLFPHEIARTFDKTYCSKLFMLHNLPTPQLLPRFRDFSSLISYIKGHGINRVFIKPQNGSSASGIIALQINPINGNIIAKSTVEMDTRMKTLRFYNNKKIQIYTNKDDIEQLVNFILNNYGHVEIWIPKARLGEKTKEKRFDLRIVVISGLVQHKVVRLSNHPFTNLHLTNMRGSFQDVLEKIGDEKWNTIKNSCLKAAELFPRAFYTALDVGLFEKTLSHLFFEINAFGDLLKHITHNNRDTYSSEIYEIERMFFH